MTTAITDFTQYSGLRAGAARDDPAVLREVASQFEALFLQTIFKNMRAGQLAEPLFESDQHDMYRDMMDQQMAVEMARGKGLGFADMLVRQLGGASTAQSATAATVAMPAIERASFAAATASRDRRPAPDWSTPAKFAADLWPHANRIAAKLDIAPEALLAQAALETGWGQHVMQRSDGSSSHNLFGIKAGTNWFGGSVVRRTLEFAGGAAQQLRERFRTYPDIAAAFDDYAKLINGNARYSGVGGNGRDSAGFAQALQDAGYATDPLYAEKIERISGGEILRDAIRPLKSPASLPISSERAANTAHRSREIAR